MRSGDWQASATMIAQALATVSAQNDEPPESRLPWSSAELRRMMGVSLLGMRRAPEAVRALSDAYMSEPGLVGVPIPNGLFGSAASMRSLVVRAVSHAQRTGDKDAWFAAAVLMQGEGRAIPSGVAKRLAGHPLGDALLKGAGTTEGP